MLPARGVPPARMRRERLCPKDVATPCESSVPTGACLNRSQMLEMLPQVLKLTRGDRSLDEVDATPSLFDLPVEEEPQEEEALIPPIDEMPAEDLVRGEIQSAGYVLSQPVK